ncbi:RNA methyltransferase [Nanoarchaeota archaeon]
MISIVLVEPEIPGNIGAVARTMGNFDFSSLVLVKPACNHLSDEARNRAKYANRILKKATILRNNKQLKKQFDYIIGTTGRLGSDYNISRSPILPQQLTDKIATLPKKKKIAIVFGRESNGLTNEELKMCDFITTIPTSKKYYSINLSHAVSIILYELSKTPTLKKEQISHFPMATRADREQLDKMFNSTLNHIKFPTIYKKRTQQIVWPRILEKALLTKRESRALMGFFSNLSKHLRVQKQPPKSKKITTNK